MRPITDKDAAGATRALEALVFFPAAYEAQVAIAEQIARMCTTAEQSDWLVGRMLELYTRWPGPREMRAVFCSRYEPKDGIEVDSGVYADGVPSEHRLLEIPLPPLPKGHLSSGDSEVDNIVSRLAIKKRLPLPPLPAKPITQADIEAELAKNKRGDA
jgi:hypothetical protein